MGSESITLALSSLISSVFWLPYKYCLLHVLLTSPTQCLCVQQAFILQGLLVVQDLMVNVGEPRLSLVRDWNYMLQLKSHML